MKTSFRKRLARALLFLGTLISLYFVPWNLLRFRLTPLPDSVQEEVENALDYDLDGLIVYVDRAGRLPQVYTAGYHNRDRQIAARPDALFKIASINKLYTAVVITKLAAAGRISFDDTLADHFPELIDRIEYANAISLRQMIQHRSGIPSYTDHPDFSWASPPATAAEKLEYALDQVANFVPGTDYHYSNTNYLLLSLLSERVSGVDQFDYVRTAILEPLCLENTYRNIHTVDSNRVMSGYYVGYTPDIKGNYFGGMVATAADVGVFLRALNDGSLLTEREQVLYPYKMSHTGLVPGYQSIARYHPDIDAVVVHFVNTSGGVSWSTSEASYTRILRVLRRE